ncbi:MAG: FHA domain-containing protein [Anaerolineales bacterium]|jgi:pSer/pThr/pTyr-binding forkhead associated (FHA) protein
MIVCQRCKASVYLGTLFCPECGLLVSSDASAPTIALAQEESDDFRSETGPMARPAVLTRQDSVALRVVGSTVSIPLAGQQDYILGRAEGTQAILPDIDLNRFGAHERGVSRLHCHLKYQNDQMVVVDLGSANGTYLNGTRLAPDHAVPVSENDTLTLGSMKVRVIRKL